MNEFMELGLKFYNGEGVKKDLKKAEDYFLKATKDEPQAYDYLFNIAYTEGRSADVVQHYNTIKGISLDSAEKLWARLLDYIITQYSEKKTFKKCPNLENVFLEVAGELEKKNDNGRGFYYISRFYRLPFTNNKEKTIEYLKKAEQKDENLTFEEMMLIGCDKKYANLKMKKISSFEKFKSKTEKDFALMAKNAPYKINYENTGHTAPSSFDLSEINGDDIEFAIIQNEKSTSFCLEILRNKIQSLFAIDKKTAKLFLKGTIVPESELLYLPVLTSDLYVGPYTVNWFHYYQYERYDSYSETMKWDRELDYRGECSSEDAIGSMMKLEVFSNSIFKRPNNFMEKINAAKEEAVSSDTINILYSSLGTLKDALRQSMTACAEYIVMQLVDSTIRKVAKQNGWALNFEEFEGNVRFAESSPRNVNNKITLMPIYNFTLRSKKVRYEIYYNTVTDSIDVDAIND